MSNIFRVRASLAQTLLAATFIALGITASYSDPIFEGRVEQTGLSARPLTPGSRFSDPPTDEELLRTTLFAQPLVPVGSTTVEENRQLAALLVEYGFAVRNGERDAVQPFIDFLAAHPNSAWKHALQVNLGAVYRRTGHFSKALETWQAAWDGSKGFTDTNGRAVGDIALAYLSQFEAYLGRKEALAPLLQETKTRPVRGSAAELVSESSSGLADMLTRPDIAFKCGPAALARILSLKPSPTSAQSQRVLADSQSTPNGLSLSAVQAISVEAGMGYQMAFRSPGAPLIVPAVAHWKVGHYAALLGKDPAGRYVVGDPTFGEDIVVSRSTLDEEASGYFLVASGQLPEGWRSVGAPEGDTVWGRGDTGSNHDNGATGPEIQAFSSCAGGGCAKWNVEAMVDGLSLHDDPIGYTPPVGPAIRFPMTYSQRDAQQPATQFTYTNFGNKWTTGWLSYVTDDAGCAGFNGATIIDRDVTYGGRPPPPIVRSTGSIVEPVQIQTVGTFCASLYRRGGGSEPYIFPYDATGVLPYKPTQPGSVTSPMGQFSQSFLTRNVDSSGNVTSFVRNLPDGSVEKFTVSLAGPPLGQNQWFMTEVDDPQGNAVKIAYDASMRIVTLTDAIGQVTTLCYNESWQTKPSLCSQPPAATNPPSNLQVTQVTDPFGRSAYFGYDLGNGHLTSITDVLGITSSFTYQPGSDFINTLTTPYGTTNFAFTDSTNDDTAGSTRSVTIIDPLNRTSRVEFHQGSATCTAPAGATVQTVDSNGITCVRASGA